MLLRNLVTVFRKCYAILFSYLDKYVHRLSDTQITFNKVMRSNLYGQDTFVYMCYSLDMALDGGVISHFEHEQAKRAIKQYIAPYAFLEQKLDINRLPSNFTYRKNLYKNWDKRPLITV